MQAVILAAGRGKRMNHLTEDQNKTMLKIKGRPILEYKLDLLPEEIDEIIFIVGYRGDSIMQHFGGVYNGKKIRYIIQEELNGTGGAIHLVKDIVKGKFLVMYGDDLYRKEDIAEIIKFDLAVLAREVEDVTKFGILNVDQEGHLLDIVEKPEHSESKLAAVGIFVLNEEFFKYELVPIGGGEFGLPQTLATMTNDQKIKILEAKDWLPIGNPEDLSEAEAQIEKFI